MDKNLQAFYDSEKYVNDENLEIQWAMRAFEEAETYFNLICTLDNRFLKLSRRDDYIYKMFRANFPDLNVAVVTDSDLKENGAKEKWRNFLLMFKDTIDNYNQGMLLRVDASKEVTDENTILVLRTQFLAIEIARNREGYNQAIRKIHRHKRVQEKLREKGTDLSNDSVNSENDKNPTCPIVDTS